MRACGLILFLLWNVSALCRGRSLPRTNGGLARLAIAAGTKRRPLQTVGYLARESLRTISNQGSIKDPETGETLDPVAFWMTTCFDWQGWQRPDRQRLLNTLNWEPEYFHLHSADKWDRLPLFRVDHLELRDALGLEDGQTYISAAQLAQTRIEDPRTVRTTPFPVWAARLAELDSAKTPLYEVERKALQLAEHCWAYQDLRMGRTLEVLPMPGREKKAWMPLTTLLVGDFDDTSDPNGRLRKLQSHLRNAYAAYTQKNRREFQVASEQFLSALSETGPELGEYPALANIAIEVGYNRWAPFRFAWLLMLVAFLALLLNLGSGWNSLYVAALGSYGAACLAVAIGFAMRITIAGRAPVTNMYESVIYVGSGVAVLGLTFFVVYRKQILLAAAAAVSTLAWVLADNCPAVFDPSVRPLEPVLRSNFWLVIHVMTITLSYAAFALALGVANVTLGYFLVRSTNRAAISATSQFTYKTIQVGVLLLAAGIILGGVWADYSWGRFWGWDPKEVWALVALLGYLAPLHARYAGWVGQRGLAALTVACFALVVVAWYGVNFVLGVGLHSYGFGAGGVGYVATAVVLQLGFAGVALVPLRPLALSPDETFLEY